MASIKSQLTLNDGMSAVLGKITSALNATLDAFEQVQRASGEAIDAASIEQARAALVGANAGIKDMAEAYREAAEQEEKLNRGLRSGNITAGSMLSKVTGIVTALGGAAALGKLFTLSDQQTSTTARLNMMVDDGGSVTELETKIMASAQRSRAYYLDTASAIASMGANAGSAFASNDELIAFMEQVNRQFVIGGATAQGQSAAMLQLTQAMAAGALRGEELNSILENAPGIARAIERYMGAAEGSIKSYAEQGLITSEVVKKALFSVADETNAKFESMPRTWVQVWTGMQNKALTVMNPILTRLNQIANSERFDTFVDGAIASFSALMDVAAVVLELLVNAGAAVVDNWSWIGPVVWGVVTAFLAYHGALLAINAAETVGAVAKGASAAASALLAKQTFAQASAAASAAVAQTGLNSALLACPVTWIILAVAAIIALIYAASAALKHLTGQTGSTTGVIVGTLAVAGAFVVNLVIGVINAIIQIAWRVVDPILGIIEYVLNIMNGGFDSFGDGVANLIGNIISWFLGLGKVVTTIIDAIFGTNWTDGLTSLQDTVTAWGKNENAITLNRNAPQIDYRIEYGFDGDGAKQAGYEFGQKIEGTVGDLFNLGNNEILDQIMRDTGTIAEDAGNAADALDVSSEQLEYLRDIAEREAINRFTTAEVKIDMTGMTNKIDGNVDLDGVLNTLTDGFAEALATAAEGVHA